MATWKIVSSAVATAAKLPAGYATKAWQAALTQSQKQAISTSPAVKTTPTITGGWSTGGWSTGGSSTSSNINKGVVSNPAPANPFKAVAYSAPNKKNYVINDYGTGWASFIWQDGTLKKYNSIADAQKAINEWNPATSWVNYNNIQQQYNDKMASAWHVTWETVSSTLEMPDTSEMSPEDAAKAMENYNFNSRMDSFQKSLTNSFDKLWFGNAEFKETVRKNMVSQLAKNQALQDELRANKQAIDAEFSTVKNKFDENTKASLERINNLEETYMAQLNNIKGLQSDYYDTQMQATNDRVAGEQAGLTNKLSAAGVNEFALGNAIGMSRTKYNQQFADIKNDNIKVLNDLNNAYKDFANDINKQKNEFNQEDIVLLNKRFDYRKDIENASKTINNDLINATFKPYEDALTAVSTQQNQEMWYEAGDQYIAERYNSGTAADRESLLQSKFSALGVSMYGKGDLSKFDLNALKVAASMPNYAEALQYLMNRWSQAAGTSAWVGSVLAAAASKQKAAVSKESTKSPDVWQPKVDIAAPDVSVNKTSTIQLDPNMASVNKWADGSKITNPTTNKQLKTQYDLYKNKVADLTRQYNATLWKSYTIGSAQELNQKKILSDLNTAKTQLSKIAKTAQQFSWVKSQQALEQWLDDNLTVI